MKSSPYITPAGHEALKNELEQLWRRLRPEVTQALAAAAAEGDRSENAEYIYRKKQLREIDRRIRYLSKRLDVLRVVRDQPQDRSRVYFGATVRLSDEAGTEYTYRIVGSDETDARAGWISIDSPIARALLKKEVGDELTVEVPAGVRVLYVDEVSY